MSSALQVRVEELAGLDEAFTITGSYKIRGRKFECKSIATWKEIFLFIAPYLMKHPNDVTVKFRLRDALLNRDQIEYSGHEVNDHDFQTITVQLLALGLVKTVYSPTTKGNMGLFWSLTLLGERLMMELRTIRSEGGPRPELLNTIVAKGAQLGGATTTGLIDNIPERG